MLLTFFTVNLVFAINYEIVNINKTHLLTDRRSAWMYLKSPQKNFRRSLYKFLCLKLQDHWTKSHQISTRCTEIIADYSAKIKIVIFQSVSERQRDK